MEKLLIFYILFFLYTSPIHHNITVYCYVVKWEFTCLNFRPNEERIIILSFNVSEKIARVSQYHEKTAKDVRHFFGYKFSNLYLMKAVSYRRRRSKSDEAKFSENSLLCTPILYIYNHDAGAPKCGKSTGEKLRYAANASQSFTPH